MMWRSNAFWEIIIAMKVLPDYIQAMDFMEAVDQTNVLVWMLVVAHCHCRVFPEFDDFFGSEKNLAGG